GFLGSLALGDIARDAGEVDAVVSRELSERDLERYLVSVLVQAWKRDAVPRDAALARLSVSIEADMVAPAQMRRHQHRQLGADHLFAGVAEDPLRRLVDQHDAAVLVDRDDRVGCGFGERAEPILALPQRPDSLVAGAREHARRRRG